MLTIKTSDNFKIHLPLKWILSCSTVVRDLWEEFGSLDQDLEIEAPFRRGTFILLFFEQDGDFVSSLTINNRKINLVTQSNKQYIFSVKCLPEITKMIRYFNFSYQSLSISLLFKLLSLHESKYVSDLSLSEIMTINYPSPILMKMRLVTLLENPSLIVNDYNYFSSKIISKKYSIGISAQDQYYIKQAEKNNNPIFNKISHLI